MEIKKIIKKIRTGSDVARRQGLIHFTIFSLQKLQTYRGKRKGMKQEVYLMADYNDVILADTRNPKPVKQTKNKNSYTFAWVMSPPGKGSGGHQNIYRFMNYLEKSGHHCRIYLYSTRDNRSIATIKSSMGDSYSKITANMEWLSPEADFADVDAIFATGWETAYPVYNLDSAARRFYFVQDFEPLFFPMGSEYILAENTYRFGFYGITAGGWLSEKLSRDYQMEADHFDFGAESSIYSLTNKGPRKEIFFYARPVTARRGFELGIMALDLFHRRHPEYVINLAGWDVSEYDIPFPYNNLKTLELNELTALYNKCAAALVISLTNMSLLPLELIACGTIPVVNDGENNRLVSDNSYIAYAENNPIALAEKLSEIVEKPNLEDYSAAAAHSIGKDGWDKSGERFVEIVEREMGRG